MTSLVQILIGPARAINSRFDIFPLRVWTIIFLIFQVCASLLILNSVQSSKSSWRYKIITIIFSLLIGYFVSTVIWIILAYTLPEYA